MMTVLLLARYLVLLLIAALATAALVAAVRERT
jgi:hypothetical protein